MTGALILAAGKGERMRPLTDVTPKPLLQVDGKPLIVWQIERLVAAGLAEIVINAAHLADQLIDAIGDGARYGARIRWSREPAPLEVGGGIATALPLLPPGPAIVAAGDVWTRYDYRELARRAIDMARDPGLERVHLLMVPNPPYHHEGDFVLRNAASPRRIALRDATASVQGGEMLTYSSIGIFDTALFAELPRGVMLKLLPLLQRWIAAGIVSGEKFEGPWANVGTPEDLEELNAQLSTPQPALHPLLP